MKDQIDALSSVIEVKSADNENRAVFKQAPVSNGNCHDKNDIPNKEQVIELVHENAEFITPGSYTKADPQNSSGYTNYDKDNMYFWHIDEGQRDSSKWINESGAEAGPIKIDETGYLVIYGWLASNAEVAAQEAWVGVYANLLVNETKSDSRDWVLLQVQPWILGKNHQVAQYVGFNLPVRAGMELKIMTGFKVNGTASALHVGNTLMFNKEGNMPNTFVGYVLTNERKRSNEYVDERSTTST